MTTIPNFFDFIESQIHDKIIIPIITKPKVIEEIKDYTDEQMAEYLLHLILRNEYTQKEIGIYVNEANIELIKDLCLKLFYEYTRNYLREENSESE